MGSDLRSNSLSSPPMSSLALRTAKNAAERRLLQRFRTHLHVWAGVLITIGALSAAGAGYFAALSHIVMPEQPGVDDQLTLGNLLIIVLATSGALLITVGALVCLKALPMFYFALFFCYFSLLVDLFVFNVIAPLFVLNLVAPLFLLNLIAPLFLCPAIFFGHRVISLAGEMQRAGVPLYLKPEQLNL
jgi:F0F1-type ATP synthase membrane subunit c/vacuolar-type H+-ATPase subunit K